MADKILQWHDGFHAALQIELQGEAAHLRFCSEYEVYKKSLRIDTVVMKDSEDKPVQKNIGKIFRKHNLIEYKSPDDYISIDDFYKVYGYACLYQSNTEKVHEISMEDITITFVCSHYPRKMMKILKQERNIGAVQKGKGIYWLTNDPVTMQIIVVTQLPAKENRWLSSLKRDLSMDMNTKRLLREYKRCRESNLYQAAMDLIMRANQKTMEEAGNMVCDALKEIFADEWRKKELQFQEKESRFQEKESRFQEKESRFQEKESRFQEKESRFQEKESRFQKKESRFQEKESKFQEKESKLQEKEAQMREKELQLQRQENRMEILIQHLLTSNLLDDLNRISVDKAYREQMYQRYGL
ncbi:MAG: 3-isopropylmalate dehydrogenase [Dorea sp.]|jgi:hypothetical protein|nr:3-isopropylmalate dehydrogenase [Dorea sp.]